MYTYTHIHTFVHAYKYAKFIKCTLIHIPILIPGDMAGGTFPVGRSAPQGNHSLTHSLTPLTPLHSTPLHAMPRHATPRHATPRHATPRHATPLHSTPLHSLAHSTQSLLSLTCTHSPTPLTHLCSLTHSLTDSIHSLAHSLYVCLYVCIC